MLARLGLELLAYCDLPTLASQSAGIMGVSHHTQPLDFQAKINLSLVCTRILYYHYFLPYNKI